MADIVNTLKQQFSQANWLNRILYINVGVFVVFIILNAILGLAGVPIERFSLEYLAIPSDTFKLITRPWTLFTYMFFHQGFGHIFFNMLILFFTGRIFMDFLGDKRILPVYVLGGLAGGILFVILYNISPVIEAGAPMIGASAGVMAILVAVATKVPNLTVRLFFLIEVKLWIVAALLILLDFAQMNSSNTGGHIAHIGGAIIGYLYIRQLDNGRDWSNSFWNVTRWFSGLFERKPKLKTVHRSRSTTSSRRTASSTSSSNLTSEQKRMDKILDKIKEHGYDKLSKDEKDFLFQFSKK